MFRFRLEIAGQVQMDRGIARFADGVSDYRPIWPVIADDFYAQEKDQFKSEGTEGGEEWQQLSPEYEKWKEVHFPGKPILQRTGDLYKSLTSASDPNTVNRQERKTLTLGSKVPYAIYHQRGTSRMPARPEIQLPEAFKRTTMHHMQVYLVQMATRYGFREGMGPLEASRRGLGGWGRLGA
ncbi:MAG: phage virion morphogenesis protein [Patescibacteria group bacterium]|nr:phage virion morphogenesis protein [Patescibacteria group bacterium]